MAKTDAQTEDAAKTKPAAKAAPKAPKKVVFESRNPEPRQFDVAGYKSIRNFNTGRIEFEIPEDDVARFENHHHVRSSRIVRKAP